MDGLEPHAERQVAILENRALAHGKGRAAAGVALAQPDLHDAFRILATRFGADASKTADLLCQRPAVGARRAFRPQLAFDVLKGGFFAEKPGIGKDGLGHGNLQ
jgi:hypothetical protein